MSNFWWQTGQWMWHPKYVSPDDKSKKTFRHVLFRKVITLGEQPISARLAVTASCIYRAYCNGQLLMHGPARGLPGTASVDIIDLTASLREGGPNVLAIEAVFAREWQAGFFGEAAGLFVALQFEGKVLDEPEGWLCYEPGAYDQSAPICGTSRPLVEIFDARKLDPRWKTASFPLEGWETPAPLGRAGTDPWSLMTEREVPYPELRETRAEIVLSRERGGGEIGEPYHDSLKPHPYDDFVLRLQNEQRLPALPEGEGIPDFTGFLRLPGNNHDATLDFERVVSGYISFSVEGSAGDVLELAWHEHLGVAANDGTVRPRESLNLRQVARYILREGVQEFRLLSEQTLRYLRIVNRSRRPVTIHHVGVVSCHVPRPAGASFLSDDTLLNRIFSAARETVTMNTADVFMDCPERERNGWFHDSYWTAFTYLMLSGDISINRRMCRMAAEVLRANPSMVFAPLYVPILHDDQIIPAHSLFWVLQAGLDPMLSGNLELGESIKHAVDQQVHGLQQYENAEGLLSDVPGWNFLDTSIHQNREIENSGPVSVPLNALYARTLDVAGRLTGQEAYRERARSVRDSLRRHCPGTLFPAFLERVEGKLQATDLYTETTQYYCLWSGVAEGERKRELWDYLRDDFDLTEEEDKFSPTHRRKKNLMRAGTYSYLQRLSVAGDLGEIPVLLQNIKRTYGFMVDHDPGTLWEAMAPVVQGSHCQGVSSSVAPILLRYVLGIQLSDDGKSVEIVPGCDEKLAWCRGQVTAAYGRISVAWNHAPTIFRIIVSLPRKYRGALKLPPVAKEIWLQAASKEPWPESLDIHGAVTVEVRPGSIRCHMEKEGDDEGAK
jgi:alpha-L-rhamnosidase